MGRLTGIFVVGICSVLILGNEGNALNPFPLGTIGCLVSDVCGSGEICVNDLLFGSCQNVFTRAMDGDNKFVLNQNQIERLETAIKKLIKAGFTWKDAFTQCTIQNKLVYFSKGLDFHRRKCADALGVEAPDWTNEMNEEIAEVLLKLMAEQGLGLDSEESEYSFNKPDYLNSNKRDEIVQVHKYFDKSIGQYKRDPFGSSSYAYLYPEKEDPRDAYLQWYGQESERNSRNPHNERDYPLLNNGDTPIVPNFLEAMKSYRREKPVVPDRDDIFNNGEQELAENEVEEDLVLSKTDENVLESLLDGKLTPEDLSPQEQRRMQVFIQGILELIDTPDREQALGDEPANISPDIDVSDDQQNRIDLDKPEDQEIVDEQTQKLVSLLKSSPEPLYDKKTMETEDNSEENSEEIEPQSSTDSRIPVNTHKLYLQLSKSIDTLTGILFINNMSKILDLPPDMIIFSRILPHGLVEINVNLEKGHFTPESFAQKAENKNDELEKETGLRVENVEVGDYPHRVKVDQNNRYVVLTFILVGSIAGVLLAAVTIYLIKRHSRSKQKLAQLAGNNSENVEASKDYQDLCRQRMQGKSSEKPEPLHAASRIGSVSETQARSPSSRSSTSSWSEEPAATNMDISTGHIVLSYMEDHLKNQDRLDREWEAVSGYVADPASTKIANDQSNSRKNRFGDILPYDHSRVALSSNVNVANSDFINASFITDHDPRNPAYICTQGPLPHTVADFWQMIWEQGSVVIVMLTKLTENGSALCHRYWPEEGSDLYHIYEVHLVSEHIWCDDYLVRSFYLKNLQTNETRTVTQFHFLTWPELSVPASIKALLDFRRKVNKSFRGRSCPIVVHCSDGCGRSGTYCLIDMVLNKMAKGAKEIDMAATLEHIRDQRMSMVKTKEQFQFSLAAVAEEVHAILKALPQ